MTTEVTSEPDSTGAGTGRLDSVRQAIGSRLGNSAWRGRAIAASLCLTSIAFVVGFLGVLSRVGVIGLLTEPLSLRIVLALPYLVTLLAAGTLLSALSGWWHGYWSLYARIHQTVLAILGLLITWQLVVLGFVP